MSAALSDDQLQTLADIDDSPDGVISDGATIESLVELDLIAWQDGCWRLTDSGEELLRAPRPG